MDHYLSNIMFGKDSEEAKFVNFAKPIDDEIILNKTSSDVVQSTNLVYLLQTLGIEHVIVCGGLVDQCISSTIRSLADRNFFVTQAIDATYTFTKDRKDFGNMLHSGYCRQLESNDIIQELLQIKSKY
jgi:nicotinamidase-related amidase